MGWRSEPTPKNPSRRGFPLRGVRGIGHGQINGPAFEQRVLGGVRGPNALAQPGGETGGVFDPVGLSGQTERVVLGAFGSGIAGGDVAGSLSAIGPNELHW